MCTRTPNAANISMVSLTCWAAGQFSRDVAELPAAATTTVPARISRSMASVSASGGWSFLVTQLHDRQRMSGGSFSSCSTR